MLLLITMMVELQSPECESEFFVAETHWEDVCARDLLQSMMKSISIGSLGQAQLELAIAKTLKHDRSRQT